VKIPQTTVFQNLEILLTIYSRSLIYGSKPTGRVTRQAPG
jgi:hypothetical protein